MEAIPPLGAHEPLQPVLGQEAHAAHYPQGCGWSSAKEDGHAVKAEPPCLAMVPFIVSHSDHPPVPPLSPQASCRDCGNRAKKDCHHQRCRTCCRKRAFTCPTHVESTWVSASRRRGKAREAPVARLTPQPKKSCPAAAEGDASDGPAAAAAASPASAGASPPTSEIKPTQLAEQGFPPPPSAALPDECSAASIRGDLPPEVRAFAVFKCLRVTGTADEHDEFAYRATAEIGGRIFKGVLYEQNTEKKENATELHLEGKRVGT